MGVRAPEAVFMSSDIAAEPRGKVQELLPPWNHVGGRKASPHPVPPCPQASRGHPHPCGSSALGSLSSSANGPFGFFVWGPTMSQLRWKCEITINKIPFSFNCYLPVCLLVVWVH